MNIRNIKLCALFIVIAFVLLLCGTTVYHTGTMYGFLVGLSAASMGLSMLFWYRFAAPLCLEKK